LATGTSIAAEKDFEQCRQFFPNGKPPIIRNEEKLQTRALCFDAFAILHSGKTHTPVYVVERLNKEILIDAQDNERTDEFFEEARLPQAERASLEDYRGSGYDRGHMAPAADMATARSMAQSFSLANIVPQNSINNRNAWAKIEKDTRKYVKRATGDVFVFTGPYFGETRLTIGLSQVGVPTYLFKLVYDSQTKRAWAHWLENTEDARVGKPISYGELKESTGIDFLSDDSLKNEL